MLLSFQTMDEKLAQVQVDDATVIVTGYQWRHRDNILGIIVLDGSEIAKLPLSRRVIGNDICNLNVGSFPSWACADKINLSCL